MAQIWFLMMLPIQELIQELDRITLSSQVSWTKNIHLHLNTNQVNREMPLLESVPWQPRCKEPPIKTQTSLGTKIIMILLFSKQLPKNPVSKEQDIMLHSHQECSLNKVALTMQRDLPLDQDKKTNGWAQYSRGQSLKNLRERS